MKVPFGEAELDALRQPLQDMVKQHLPTSLEAVADDAAQAALEKLSLHVAAAEANVDRCKADHQSLREIWELERKAAAEGDLKWCFFVATKKRPNSKRVADCMSGPKRL